MYIITVTLQLAHLFDDDVNLKMITKLCEAESYDDENDNVLMQNIIVSNANDRNDKVVNSNVNSNVTGKSDTGTLSSLS